MSELQQPGTSPEKASPTVSPAVPPLFAPKGKESGGIPPAAWVAAGVVLLVVLGMVILSSRHKSSNAANTILPPDPYAASLPLSDPVMSESANLSGGKYTYIDGRVRNAGTATVTGVTVQVLFRNEEQMPPQIETLPLALIRTRQPYIDTQPVSVAPLKPGDEREFRLIFETITGNWNYQMPEIRVVKVQTR